MLSNTVDLEVVLILCSSWLVTGEEPSETIRKKDFLHLSPGLELRSNAVNHVNQCLGRIRLYHPLHPLMLGDVGQEIREQ